jgi:hypothetical protein
MIDHQLVVVFVYILQNGNPGFVTAYLLSCFSTKKKNGHNILKDLNLAHKFL